MGFLALRLSSQQLHVSAQLDSCNFDGASSANCRYTLRLRGLGFHYFCSHDLSTTHPGVRTAILIQHGTYRNARDYFRSMSNTVAATGQGGSVAIIAPRFRCPNVRGLLPADLLVLCPCK